MRKVNPSFRSSSLSEPLAKRPIRICRTSVSLSEPQSLFPTSKSAGSNLTKCRKTPWGSLSARRLIKPCVDHRPARIWPRIEGYASLLNYIVPTLSIGDHRSEQLNDTNDISTRTQHFDSNDHCRSTIKASRHRLPRLKWVSLIRQGQHWSKKSVKARISVHIDFKIDLWLDRLSQWPSSAKDINIDSFVLTDYRRDPQVPRIYIDSFALTDYRSGLQGYLSICYALT